MLEWKKLNDLVKNNIYFLQCLKFKILSKTVGKSKTYRDEDDKVKQIPWKRLQIL